MFQFFFFNDTATTEIYTLSLHDALPISDRGERALRHRQRVALAAALAAVLHQRGAVPLQRGEVHPAPPGQLQREARSEEHTSELQSRQYLVCRLLLEKKNNTAAHRDLHT